MPIESAYERYRRVSIVNKSCSRKKTSYFIKNHESSTIIRVERTAEELPAVIIMNHTEGADNALLYVYADADLKLGDYFTWKEDYHFFALERVTIIKDIDYKKFTALECNVLVNNHIWGYFLGNKRSLKTTSLNAGYYEVENLQPVLIVPTTSEIEINGYIDINNQKWRVTSADLDSISGIGYYYLERALNDRDLEAEQEQLEERDDAPTSNTVYVGQEIRIETQNGYIKADNITVLKRSANSVIFKPNKIGALTVSVARDGELVAIDYEVREV